MKKTTFTAFILAFSAIFCGCSEKSESSQPSVIAEEMKVSPESIGFEWQEPYRNKLLEFKKSKSFTESNGINGSMFDLFDIDRDGTPELIISPSSEINKTSEIFTLADGKAVSIGENGCGGCFSYYADTMTVDHEYRGDGFVMGEFRNISGSKLNTEISYYNNASSASLNLYDPGNTGKTIKYKIDSFEVSLPEYDQAVKVYTDQPNIQLGRRYTFTDSSIDYALLCSESWGAVMSDERKDKCVKKLTSLLNEYEGANAAFDLCDLDGDKIPELIISEGDSAEDMCRIFCWNDKQLNELDFKKGFYGKICLDSEKHIFFSSDEINEKISASISGGTMIQTDKRSGSIIDSGRRYPLCEEYIIGALR